MGGLEKFGNVALPIQHGRRQSVLCKMVQGRSRILPVHARIESTDARIWHGRRKRGREYKVGRLVFGRFLLLLLFFFFIYFRVVNYFIARRVAVRVELWFKNYG